MIRSTSLVRNRRPGILPGCILTLLFCAGPALAQATDSAEQGADAPTPNEDMEVLLRRMESMESSLLDFERLATGSRPGKHQFLVTGFASTAFVNAEGTDSTFTTAFNPIFLYKYGENFLFEAELEFAFNFGEEGGETEVGVGYANGSYIVNDNLIVGAGKFLTPFGIFTERIHPAWINKLPTSPLTAGHMGIIPMSSIGAFARGGLRTGSVKWNYTLYVSNGPRLNTGETEPGEAGMLHFDNYADTNNSKSVGLRVGFLPIPMLELGVSALTGEVTPSGSEVADATSTLLGADLSYNPRMAASSGRLEFRAEWVVSDVDDVTYDPTGAGGFGPLSYTNRRQGGYLQAAYRLPGRTQLLSPWECVARYDTLRQPSGAPMSINEERLSLGLNRWLTPTSLVKAAYQFDDRSGGAQNNNAFILQLAIGF